MSQQDIDNMKRSINDSFSQAYSFLSGTEARINSATAEASSGVRKSLSAVLEGASQTKNKAQEATSTVQTKYKSAEDKVLSEVRKGVKGGVQWYYDYPLFAYMGLASSVFLFPGPRAFVARNVFGMFQSQESSFRSATEKFATLAQTSETLAKQKTEALATASTALDALSDAHAKAATAAKELAKLEAQYTSTTSAFEDVREGTAALRHKDAISLRADIVRTANEVKTEQKDVSSVLAKLQAYV